MIKVITFDLDDTLWSIDPVIASANKKLYEWYQVNAPRYTEQFDHNHYKELQKQTHTEFPERSYSVTAVRKTMIELGLSQAGYHGKELENMCEAAFEVFLTARNEVSFFRHAIPVIETLHPQFQLGAISNGNADIYRVGLDRFFDFAFHADHIGIGKPDSKIFQAMLEHTGCQPEQVLHIGDNLDHDVHGANQAGLHSLWVNLNNQRNEENIVADIEVSCLSDIPGAVESYQSQLKQQR